LTCTGTGGSQAASVTVSMTAEQRSSGGGGGSDPMLLALLVASLVGARCYTRRSQTAASRVP
jgi:hypothetical protein